MLQSKERLERIYGMPLSSETTFKQICKALGFSDNPGLLVKDARSEKEERFKTWIRVIEKFRIDAILFIQTQANSPIVPIIYFKKTEMYDEKGIADLHKEVWNQGRIPLLFVISPGEARIYNCFEPPPASEREPFDDQKRLIKYLKTLVSIENIRHELSSFTYDRLASGRFWYEKRNLFNLSNRADIFLLNNLRSVKKVLEKEGLEDKYIHRLIARSILMLCLEDRGTLREFFKTFRNGLYTGFREVKSKYHAYEIFEKINEHFNGDIFPITEQEKNAVSEKHYAILKEFLLGTNPETHQTRLWPYRFDIIPIEFISNVYEEFFHSENEPLSPRAKSIRNLGTYYTPQSLVSLILDEMLSWDENIQFPKVLDPSCGSGIFLVEAYRRIVSRIDEKEEVNINTVKQILQNCIFGVDINEEAISITALSLYLTMLDYIPIDSLWRQPKLFPKLINANLFPVDFFDTFAQFNKMKFDFVIGNVPWLSVDKSSNTKALRYCQLSHRSIGDRQMAQAFIWKALDLVKVGSEICLIMGAKSLLFNRSDKNKSFRRELLKETNVQTIVNLSVLRQTLFNRSVGPAAIIHCKKKASGVQETNSVTYICPKTSLETKYVGAIIIDKSDYSRIPLELALDDDSIWKVAMWGTPRDLELIAKVRAMGTLGKIIERERWEIGDGFQKRGSDQRHAQWLLEYPHIPAKSLVRYSLNKESFKKITDSIFNRPRTKKRYTAPLCLVKVTLKNGEPVAAFSDLDVTYTDGVIGISGKPEDADLLKILCCYLNSDVAKYFLFLTCSVWGVERDDILKDDLVNLPAKLPEKGSEAYESLLHIYDSISSFQKRHGSKEEYEICEERINEIFLNLFSINEIERKLIMDTVNYTIDYYQRRHDSIAIKPVDRRMLCEYAKHSLSLLNSVAKENGSIFNSKIYLGSEGLKVVLFSLEHKSGTTPIEVTENSTELNNTLNDLFKRLKNKRQESFLLRRITRIYEGSKVFIVKPNEQRYWTEIEAYKDTDDMLSEIFATWREEGLFQKMNTA
jgi:type I restriction-modification system DNA methylase subunit